MTLPPPRLIGAVKPPEVFSAFGQLIRRPALDGQDLVRLRNGSLEGEDMIVTIAKVADFDQFLKTFSTKGAEKRKQHECAGSHVFRPR